jgi:hypothetical protein
MYKKEKYNMPRYKASINVELSRKEKMKVKVKSPEMFRFMKCSEEVFSFEVKAINAEEAFKKVTVDALAGKYNQSIKGRNYSISPIHDNHRLADTLEQIQNDDDVFYLGFICIGKMTDLYPSIPEEFQEDYYRTWIWDDKNKRIATSDLGNGWCSYLCGGSEEELLSYFNESR